MGKVKWVAPKGKLKHSPGEEVTGVATEDEISRLDWQVQATHDCTCSLLLHLLIVVMMGGGDGVGILRPNI